MPADNHDPVKAFIEKLHRQDEERRRVRRNRKMVGLEVSEVSGVADPAHGVSGWLVKKSSSEDSHQHRTDSDYLAGPALEQVRYYLDSDTIPAGAERPIQAADKSRVLGRGTCGCLYMRTPETIARAAGQAYTDSVTKAAPQKRIWTAAEAAYLTSATNKILGRDS